uniref:Ileal sodium/bile acid cotransporter n=1 Tax=Phallusia mammillata TaxID=59560 RepID=A0A6F9DSY7_9ASCI|nr:ileal sodium/bile acid cotransporter [Phallusia mammillata]
MNISTTTSSLHFAVPETTIQDVGIISGNVTDDAIGTILQTTQKLSFIAVIAIMFGLGCSASATRIMNFIKKPKHFLTGIALQLIALPLMGFAITRILSLDMPKTIAMIIQSSSPGGTYSNIVTYWLDGDMDLSIIMTTVSTLLAMGALPLWLYTFSAILHLEENLRVPFGWLGAGLATMIFPVLLGMIVQRFFPSKCKILTRIFTILGSLAVLGVAETTIAVGTYGLKATSAMGAVALLEVCAVATGYGVTRIPFLKFTVPERRTVAIEIVFQSVPVAFNIILLSYQNSPSDVLVSMVSLPFFYGTLQFGTSVILVITYLVMKKFGVKVFVPEDESSDVILDEAEVATDALMKNEDKKDKTSE